MERTVAVTGGSGFIGSRLVPCLLDRGFHVRVLTRRLPVNPAYGARRVEAVIGDLSDPGSLRSLMAGADAVIHAAGLIKASSRDAFFAANAAGTRLVVEAARSQPAPLRVVLLSSLAAREPQLSDYAASKRAGETALAHAGGGLHWTVLRPPAVYGPGDREILAFFRAARRGLVPAPPAMHARVSMIHVDDLARAVLAVLDSDSAAGAVLELDDGRPGGYRWGELAAAAGAALGTNPRLLRIPSAGLQALVTLNRVRSAVTGRPAMLSRGKMREICHPDWSCRSDEIRRLTAWQPTVGIEEGFRETVAWYRAAGWL